VRSPKAYPAKSSDHSTGGIEEFMIVTGGLEVASLT
jgi:hypothetical protein